MAVKKLVFTDGEADPSQAAVEVVAEGMPTAPSYKLPSATASVLGGVKQSAVTALVAAADAIAASGEAVTVAEFNKVVTLLNECKAKLNSVISADRASGQAASK